MADAKPPTVSVVTQDGNGRAKQTRSENSAKLSDWRLSGRLMLAVAAKNPPIDAGNSAGLNGGHDRLWSALWAIAQVRKFWVQGSRFRVRVPSSRF